MHWTQPAAAPLIETGSYAAAYFVLTSYNIEYDPQGNQSGFTFYANGYESKTYYDTEVAAGRTPVTFQRGPVPFQYENYWRQVETRTGVIDGEFVWEPVETMTTDWTDHFPGIDTLDEFETAVTLDYGATFYP